MKHPASALVFLLWAFRLAWPAFAYSIRDDSEARRVLDEGDVDRSAGKDRGEHQCKQLEDHLHTTMDAMLRLSCSAVQHAEDPTGPGCHWPVHTCISGIAEPTSCPGSVWLERPESLEVAAWERRSRCTEVPKCLLARVL